MSEPKRISPLLDGFELGNPMSDHDGVQCRPAIKENTDKKYILKIISVPASQVQMDALLLAGAYKDPADAMDYFKEVADGIAVEAETLQKLSKLEGFLPHEGWQIEPITKRRLGYEVYLISTYKRPLEKYVRRNPVTHLEAVNLGLDMCSALSVCRQAGYLYVDLKPSNIFISEDKAYRIGDLGFIGLDSLKYSSLPEKYRSPYTPPELHDPMATLNDTADTYALGMILYQLYNDGQLPFKDKAPEDALPSPVNADYEIAEIIMKAIHPDPKERWAEPKEMGQALVAYMQRNSINDTPITPHTPIVVDPEDVVTAKKEEPTEEAAVEAASEQPAAEEAAPGDETAPSEETTEELQDYEMSEELTKIVAKADDLIAHETPEGVVIPEVPELPDPFAFAEEDKEDTEEDIPEEELMEEPEEAQQPEKKKKEKKFLSPEYKRKVKQITTTVAAIVILAVIGTGVFWLYQNYYLQTIDSLTINGSQTQLTVIIDADVDETLLTVICTDNYGNATPKEVVDGKAVFTDLLPNSMYKIQLEIDGFHKLVGQTSDIFSTDAITNIVSFSAITGPEDGSVMLNFTVDGGEPEEWVVAYSAEGEETQRQSFTGHSVTITGLSVGKTYTFALEADIDLNMAGASTLEFMASRLILAQDLTITSSGDGGMTVSWKAPGDIVVDSWDVRCYSDSGYDKSFTVTDNEVFFADIDPTVAYTVEITAAGMTQPARTSITANPLTVTALNVDDSEDGQLSVSWEHTGTAPTGGWLLMYSIDSSNIPDVIKCEEATAVISPRIPGAKYEFVLQAADGTSIFSNVHTYTCPNAAVYEGNGLSGDSINAHLVKTPEEADWRFDRIGEDAFTDQFAVGDKISIVLHAKTDFYLNKEDLEILYVIRDGYGNVIPDYVSQDTGNWKDIWSGGNYHYGELDLPKAPDKAGDYSLCIYFNNTAIAVIKFSVTE